VCWQATGVPDTVLEDQTGGLAGAIDAPFLVSACGTAELERFQGTFDRGTLRVTQDQPTVTIQIDDDALRERLEGSWNDGATSAQLLLESHPSSPGAVRYAIGQLIGLDATLAIGPIDGLNETGLGLDDDGFPVLEPFGVDAQITLSLVDPDDPTVVTDAITDAGQAALTLTEISGGER